MSTDVAALASGVRRLWQAGRGSLLAQAIVIEDAIAAASDGTLDEEQRREAERVAHKLIGSAGAYGFVRAAIVARELEHRFAAGPLDTDSVVACAELAEELTVELDVDEPPAASSAEATEPGVGRDSTILLVHPEAAWRHAVAVGASDRHLGVLHAGSIGEAEPIIRANSAGVVVAAATSFGDGADPMALLEMAAATDPQMAAIVLGDPTSVMDRVEASRRGVARFVDLDAAPADVVEVVTDVLSVRHRDAPCVLAVDDDRHVLAQVRRALSGRGYEVRTLSDATRLWKTLEKVTPDVVVLDWEMPAVSGDEVCRALRTDSRWTGTPILVLTAHTDAETLMKAFSAGADDFVAKPLVGPVLACRIENRLERLRLLRSLADRDVLTGLPHRGAGHRELDHMLERGARNGEPVAMALIEVDGLGAATRDHGYEVGDRLVTRVAGALRRQFSSHDVVATWTTGRFIVGMLGLSGADAVQRIAEALERVRGESVVTAGGQKVEITVTGGVAEHPADGSTVDEIVHRADDALTMARQLGGDCVIPAGWDPDQDARLIDVAIVEDDPQLAEVLIHALKTRGLRACWLRDGVEAVAALTGSESSPPEVVPRVILLDVNLPGISGMTVLRRLGETVGIGRTKVVMLTARSAESDVIAALSLGAVDHIAKPFSVPVLLERLRRHLTV